MLLALLAGVTVPFLLFGEAIDTFGLVRPGERWLVATSHDALRFGKTLDDGGAGQITRLEEFARLVASVVGRPML